MPKMKTKSAVKKRFSVTASGKVKVQGAHKRHRLISKPTKMKRQARGTMIVAECDAKKILRHYLPYAK